MMRDYHLFNFDVEKAILFPSHVIYWGTSVFSLFVFNRIWIGLAQMCVLWIFSQVGWSHFYILVVTLMLQTCMEISMFVGFVLMSNGTVTTFLLTINRNLTSLLTLFCHKNTSRNRSCHNEVSRSNMVRLKMSVSSEHSILIFASFKCFSFFFVSNNPTGVLCGHDFFRTTQGGPPPDALKSIVK